jgi:hypothetical protein
MMIVGVDYQPSFQQIAFCTQQTGEYVAVAGPSFLRSDLRSGDKALSLFAPWYRGYGVIA